MVAHGILHGLFHGMRRRATVTSVQPPGAYYQRPRGKARIDDLDEIAAPMPAMLNRFPPGELRTAEGAEEKLINSFQQAGLGPVGPGGPSQEGDQAPQVAAGKATGGQMGLSVTWIEDLGEVWQRHDVWFGLTLN